MEYFSLCVICVLNVLRCFHSFDRYYSKYIVESFNFKFTNEEEENFANFERITRLIFVLMVLLIGDMLKYKPIIVLSSITALLRYILFYFKPSVELVYVIVTLNAFFDASTITFVSYLYGMYDDKSTYQRITAFADASVLFGAAISLCFGLLHVDILHMKLEYLLCYNTAIAIITTSLSFAVPQITSLPSTQLDTEKNFLKLWRNFKKAYGTPNVLKWSLWWSLSLFLSQRITQPWLDFFTFKLMESKDSSINLQIVHPLETCACFIASALIVIMVSRKPTKWHTRGDHHLSLASFVLSTLTIAQYVGTMSLITRYMINTTFAIVVEVTLNISFWEMAQILPKNSYALVIGFNTFVTQSLLQFLPFSARVADFLSNQEYMIYGLCFAFVGVVFCILAIFSKFDTPNSNLRRNSVEFHAVDQP